MSPSQQSTMGAKQDENSMCKHSLRTYWVSVKPAQTCRPHVHELHITDEKQRLPLEETKQQSTSKPGTSRIKAIWEGGKKHQVVSTLPISAIMKKGLLVSVLYSNGTYRMNIFYIECIPYNVQYYIDSILYRQYFIITWYFLWNILKCYYF